MRIRLDNLSKWQLLGDSEWMDFEGARRRTVVLEVNSPDWVKWFIRQDTHAMAANPEIASDIEAGRAHPSLVTDREPIEFLATTRGRATIEFGVDGPFSLRVEGEYARVYSHDGQRIATHVVEPLIYTRVANRRQRNPHLEMIQYQMRLNQEAFAKSMEAEVERRVKAIEARLETYAPQRNQVAPIARPAKTSGSEGIPGGGGSGGAGEGGADETEGGAGGGVSEGEPAAAPASDTRRKTGKAPRQGLSTF